MSEEGSIEAFVKVFNYEQDQNNKLIEKLETENKRLKSEIKEKFIVAERLGEVRAQIEYGMSNARLQIKVKDYEEVLEFYKSKHNWAIPKVDSRGFTGMSAKSPVELDRGAKAREVREKHSTNTASHSEVE